MVASRKVEAKISIDRLDPSLVIEAFTDIQHIKKWWGVSKCLIELKPGGIYCLAWQKDETCFSYISSGMVRSYQPASYLILDRMVYMNPKFSLLGPMSLDIRIHDDGSSLWLKIKQSGYQEGEEWDWYYEAVRAGWPKALNNLEDYLSKIAA